MMLQKKLEDYQLILASASPRRQQFFKEMGLDFEVRLRSVDEIYPNNLKGAEISDYLAQLKAKAFEGQLKPKDILITSDTVVWYKNESLEKASSEDEAYLMLRKLSNDWHNVITSVCFTSVHQQQTKNRTTQVKFKALSDSEINYYIKHYQPFDKAGAYGIQEWIGLIGIEEIKGSYANMVGLPTQMLYETLTAMAT